jgi:hypothetical protein
VERYTRSPTLKLGGDRVVLAAILSFDSIKSCLITSLMSTVLVSRSVASAVAPVKGNNLAAGVDG